MNHITQHKLSGVYTCLTASALLRGGCGLGFKSGWTAESQAWHCCRVSCRLTCLWSSCSKVWYTWNKTIKLQLWELSFVSINMTGIKWHTSTSPLKWITPPGLPNTIHISIEFAYVPKYCKAQLPCPVYNFSTHTLQCYILSRERMRQS